MTPAQVPNHSASESFLLQPPASKSGNTLPTEVDAEELASGPERNVRAYRLGRFWTRTSVVILAPVAILVYFLWIWLYCLRDTSPVKYAPFDQVWIYYTWFITGVFGLDISRHGLLGVEAAMLQTPFWQARSTMVVLMHSGATWSGPGGWRKGLTKLLSRTRSVTGRLWHLLTLLSVMPFIAFPISGLTMELTDSYVPSTTPAMVVGRTWTDFNLRQWLQTFQRGTAAWSNWLPTTFHGIGLAYTPPHLGRGQYSFLDSVPNTLPTEGGIPELLLTAQATSPVGGKTWGLRIGYNCSVVESASEFTVLNQKSSARGSNSTGILGAQGVLQLSTPLNSSIYVFNATDYRPGGGGITLWAYAEMGLTTDPNSAYGGSEPVFPGPDGAIEADVLEYALWQVQFNSSYRETDETLGFNASVEPSIAGMGHPLVRQPDGNYTTNRTFFALRHDSAEEYAEVTKIGAIRSLADPIGVRCRRVSDLGEAGLDVKRSVFTSFKKSPSPPFNESEMESPTPRFGGSAATILAGRYFELFTTINAPPPVAYSNSAAYSNFIQPKTLLASIMRAHAVDALQLMYDGVMSLDGAYLNPNLTTTRRGKILQPGAVPAAVPAVLFLLWYAGSLALGLKYGFCRRWSASLDGYSLFRFGADFSDELGDGSEVSSVRPFDKCDELSKLPGLVGDSRVNFHVGHVSLVETINVVNPRKLYN